MRTQATDRELLEDLRDGPEGARIIAEREQRLFAERKKWAGSIAVLESEHEKARPALEVAEEAAGEGVRSAEAALKAAREAWGVAYSERRGAAVRLDSRRSALEAQLRETAPEEIAVFIGELSAEFERCRRHDLEIHPGRRDFRGELSPTTTNAESVNARLAGLQTARREAEALALRALTPEELVKALSRIRAAIPAVEAI